jgi:2-desacetyl-2-hydroxyethyl bacteriochlorophyllide A dehydrogenase
MKRRHSLFFRAPFEVDVCREPISAPGYGEVLVQAEVSAISPGTEMLFYRDQVPAELPVDATIEELGGAFSYPLKYGYAVVGRVQALGPGVDDHWLDQRVFVFHPHESHFVTAVTNLHLVPEELAPESAVFLPLMETAVSFLMDGQPMIGERVVLFGQGIVGLLTTAMLAAYPLANLVTLDPFPLRRQWSRRLGAKIILDPAAADAPDWLRAYLSGEGSYQGADLIFELSGNPEALDQAITIAGYDGRVLIGSWYGKKKASLTLGSRFHRSNVRLISSQVSFIAPRWRGRFTQARRLHIAWSMLAKYDPARMISHRFPISQAHQAYQLLDQDPGSTVQVLLTYEDST